MKVEENDADAIAHPKKKLKQARLPFQIFSPGGDVSPPEKNRKKRKLSEASGDDIKVIKVIKSNGIEPSAESKENLNMSVKEPVTCKDKTEGNDNNSDNDEIVMIDGIEPKNSDSKNDSKKIDPTLSENDPLSKQDLSDSKIKPSDVCDNEDESKVGQNSNKPKTISDSAEEKNEVCKESPSDKLISPITNSLKTPKESKNSAKTKRSNASKKKLPLTDFGVKSKKAKLSSEVMNDSSCKKLDSAKKSIDIPEAKGSPSLSSCQLPATEKKDELPSAQKTTQVDNSVRCSPQTPDSGSIPEHRTPTSSSATKTKKLTPKQLLKQMDSEKKKEEKEKLKQEREKKKAEEKEAKEKQKLEEKQKKLEEKEKKRLAELEAQRVKTEQKKKEKEEKERKKAAELEQKEEEKRVKEEEKRKKEEIRLEEKRKKEERRLAEEEAKKKEEELKKKESAAFTSYFRSVKTDSKSMEETKHIENFMPFEVKADMRLAPLVRNSLNNIQKEALDHALNKQEQDDLYLDELVNKTFTPKCAGPTWHISELINEIQILDDDDDMLGVAGNNVVIDRHPLNNSPHPKLLQFWDNRRPPYWGTWRKKSSFVKPRAPFGKDEKLFDYEVDSDEEWEEEEPGESLHGSDDEKESEDEYEVDNDFFVPHGYLSEEENEHEEDEKVSPELLKAKLKLLEIEFQEEMKQKTECIKPRVIGCIWLRNNTHTVGPRLQQLLTSHRAVFSKGSIITSVKESETADHSPSKENASGPKKKKFPEEAIPALIKLIHGNVNGRVFLVKEFLAHLKNEMAPSAECNTAKEDKLDTSNKDDTIPTTNDTGISKMSIVKKIRELSSWMPCPEEGVMQGRSCWYVPPELRAKFGLEELAIPNKVWNYFHVPKRELDFQTPVPSPALSNEVAEKPVNPTEKPTKTLPLITKFTKKMTCEELQKQLLQSPGEMVKKRTC